MLYGLDRVGCLALILDFAGVLMIWNRSDMHLTSGMTNVARVGRSFKSGAPGQRWATQAQLMRSEIFETSMFWAGSFFESRAAISERKVS